MPHNLNASSEITEIFSGEITEFVFFNFKKVAFAEFIETCCSKINSTNVSNPCGLLGWVGIPNCLLICSKTASFSYKKAIAFSI